MAMSTNIGGCQGCGWQDYLCVCSSLEPLDEGVGVHQQQRPRPPFADESFDLDFAALEREMLPLRNGGYSLYTNQGEEESRLNDSSRASVEEKCPPKESGNNNGDKSASEVVPEESPSERKRIKEKKRREGMNKGFQELAKLLFVIDPDLKERTTSKKRSMGMRPDENQPLDRVELVNIAVTTLARVHQDNEAHKMLISHLTSVEESNGSKSDGMPLVPALPNTVVSALTPDGLGGDNTTADEEDSKGLSQAEIKRNKEKKRRTDINRGLDQLLRMIFIIDPFLKAMAEERAKVLHATMSSIKDSQLLGKVEQLENVVGTLTRIHSENEIHKAVIARLARARCDTSSRSPASRNVVSPSGDSHPPSMKSSPPDVANHLGNDTGTSQGDESTGTLQEQATSVLLTRVFSQGETWMDGNVHEQQDGEPAPKRFKTVKMHARKGESA